MPLFDEQVGIRPGCFLSLNAGVLFGGQCGGHRCRWAGITACSSASAARKLAQALIPISADGGWPEGPVMRADSRRELYSPQCLQGFSQPCSDRPGSPAAPADESREADSASVGTSYFSKIRSISAKFGRPRHKARVVAKTSRHSAAAAVSDSNSTINPFWRAGYGTLFSYSDPRIVSRAWHHTDC